MNSIHLSEIQNLLKAVCSKYGSGRLLHLSQTSGCNRLRCEVCVDLVERPFKLSLHDFKSHWGGEWGQSILQDRQRLYSTLEMSVMLIANRRRYSLEACILLLCLSRLACLLVECMAKHASAPEYSNSPLLNLPKLSDHL